MKETKNTDEEKLNEQTAEDAAQEPQTEDTAQTNAPADEKTETQEDTDPLQDAEKTISELKDKYLRSVAEFDNYRKRTIKEKAELILNGGEKTIAAILPVIDDMERAIANNEHTDDATAIKEGMQLIYNKFIKALAGLGVSAIDTENADFDVDVHEAVAMVPGMGDDKKGKVLDCVQKGYKLNDKVIRHAKVAVGQ